MGVGKSYELSARNHLTGSQCRCYWNTRILRLYSSAPALGQEDRRFRRRWYPSSLRCRGVCSFFLTPKLKADIQIRRRLLPIDPRRQARSRACQAGRIQILHADQGSRSPTPGCRWSSRSIQPRRLVDSWLLQLQALEPPLGQERRFSRHCRFARSKWTRGVRLSL
jgi:hypothetical protein